MKALSVRAPHAGRIASGAKTLEVRSRRTHYRGLLTICQAGGGGAVAEVELVDCREGCAEDARGTGGGDPTGYYVWELRLVRRLCSPRISGQLGIWTIPDAVAATICTAP